MDTMEAILSRRSIRKFTAEAVSDEDVKDILKAAMSAPSAGNQQPWHFVVIRDKLILDEIPKFHPHAKMLNQAPCAILVCGDESLEKHKGYWIQDCAAATENMLLAIHAKGLGGVWLGIYPREERIEGLRSLMHTPSSVIPFALVAVGHSAELKGREDRFDPDRVHRNAWTR